MKFVGIIPARYASTRFPGKPLAMLAGKPMICHVCEKASAGKADYVLVATDDERIAKVVEEYGYTAVMTRNDHPSGTDRQMKRGQSPLWRLSLFVCADTFTPGPAKGRHALRPAASAGAAAG